MAESKSKKLSSFPTVNDCVEFFDSHDMGDYWEQMPEAEFEVNLKSKESAGNSKWRANQRPTKSIRNTGKPWTSTQVTQLRQLARQNTPTRVIGLKLGRTENAVRTKASENNISLKPVNQSPYSRNKK